MILFRYICKQIYLTMLAITVIMILIVTINQFMSLLHKASSGVITMAAVFKIMSVQIPMLLGYLLPMGLYISIMLVLGRMYMDNEMTVLFACGVSRAKLLGMIMALSGVVMVAVAILMFWVEPLTERYEYTTIGESVATASLQKIIPKRFQPIGKQGVFYANSLSRKKNEMYNVFFALEKGVSNKPKHHSKPYLLKKWDIVVAKVAREKTMPKLNGKFLVFSDGMRYSGTVGDKAIQQMNFAQYGVRLFSGIIHVGGGAGPVSSDVLWAKRHTSTAAAGVLQWRLAITIMALILPLIAFALSKVNPRRGRYMQIIPAVIIYIAYGDLCFLCRSWIIHGKLNPALGFWWLHGAMLLLAILLLIHSAGWKRVYRMFKGRKHAIA